MQPRFLRARWLIPGVIAVLAAGGAVAFAATRSVHPPTAAVYVSVTSPATLVSAANYATKAAASYADIARRPLVLDPVITELNLHVTSTELAQHVNVSVPKNTVVIEISATGADRVESALIANAVSQHLIDVSSSLTP